MFGNVGVIDDHELAAYDETQNAEVMLPPFQTDSAKEKNNSTETPLHIERASSFLSGTTCKTRAGMSELSQLPTNTTDERLRRQTLEEDLYADAIRSVTS